MQVVHICWKWSEIMYRVCMKWLAGFSHSCLRSKGRLPHPMPTRYSKALLWSHRRLLHSSVARYEKKLPQDLQELISQGEYDRALDLWEEEKGRGSMSPSLYRHVMLLCERIGSATAAKAIGEDMARQGIVMDKECWLHFVNTLLLEGLQDEAEEYIRTSTFKDDPHLLRKVAISFVKCGFSQLALSVCQLSDRKESDSELVAFQLETMGSLKMLSEMDHLVTKCYGDSPATVPHAVNLGKANGLALAGESVRAMEALCEIKSAETRQLAEGEIEGKRREDGEEGVPLRSLVLLLENTQPGDCPRVGLKAYSQLWSEAKAFSFKLENTDCHTAIGTHQRYLQRAVNAFIYCQAFTLKESGLSTGDPELPPDHEQFVQHNFYAELQTPPFYSLPTPDTVAALILLCCFNGGNLRIASEGFRVCAQNGVIDPNHLTKWTQLCGTLYPGETLPVLRWLRNHSNKFGIPLGLQQYGQLLDVRYNLGSREEWRKDAVTCVRTIKNTMTDRSMLSTHEAFHLIMHAQVHVKDTAGLIHCYMALSDAGLEPTVETYHTLLDIFIKEGTMRHTSDTVFRTWRKLVREYPRIQPDVVLMNKFILCCRLCRHYDRAFFFLSTFKDFSLVPDLSTFEELLEICRLSHDYEKLDLITSLATSCLPNHKDTVATIAEHIRAEGNVNHDTKQSTNATSSGDSEDDRWTSW